MELRFSEGREKTLKDALPFAFLISDNGLRRKTVRQAVGLFVAIIFLAGGATRAEQGGACAYLAGLIDKAPAGPVFLASYPTIDQGPLKDAAYLYDNAAAVIALVGCGERDRAARIGTAMLWAMDHDRAWHDGRLRNAYLAGRASVSPSRMPGWWDAQQERWLEDRYQVGSDEGNMAWAMLAFLALDDGKGQADFRAGAIRLGRWAAQWRDRRGAGGFTGGTFGHEPEPVRRMWKSTEHNTDLAAAFALLAERTGDAQWRENSAAARGFVEAMWDGGCRCFPAGTGEDGVTLNRVLALDAQIWPLTALSPDKFPGALETAEKRLKAGAGYSYGEARDGIWTEGTGQMAVLLASLGKQDATKRLLAVIEAQRAPDGGYYATSGPNLPTGFALDTDMTKPRLYFHLPHLGAAAWAALAECGFNPFKLR